MNTQITQNSPAGDNSSLSWGKVLLIVLVTILITVAGTWWALSHYLFAKDFKPVVLEQSETIKLDRKLNQLGFTPKPSQKNNPQTQGSNFDLNGNLKPEPYSETNSNRVISFSERELNALLANNTELAKKLAVDLSNNLMSARMLVPVDRDFPVLGGKTLRFSGGIEVSYQNNRPIVILKGVSIMGVPVPNAWLGGIKNIDLVKEFSVNDGFWKAFSEGVDNISVKNGQLRIKLKE